MEGNRPFIGKNRFAKTRYNCTWTTLKRWIYEYDNCYNDLIKIGYDPYHGKEKLLSPIVQDMLIKHFG